MYAFQVQPLEAVELNLTTGAFMFRSASLKFSLLAETQ